MPTRSSSTHAQSQRPMHTSFTDLQPQRQAQSSQVRSSQPVPLRKSRSQVLNPSSGAPVGGAFAALPAEVQAPGSLGATFSGATSSVSQKNTFFNKPGSLKKLIAELNGARARFDDDEALFILIRAALFGFYLYGTFKTTNEAIAKALGISDSDVTDILLSLYASVGPSIFSALNGTEFWKGVGMKSWAENLRCIRACALTSRAKKVHGVDVESPDDFSLFKAQLHQKLKTEVKAMRPSTFFSLYLASSVFVFFGALVSMSIQVKNGAAPFQVIGMLVSAIGTNGESMYKVGSGSLVRTIKELFRRDSLIEDLMSEIHKKFKTLSEKDQKALIQQLMQNDDQAQSDPAYDEVKTQLQALFTPIVNPPKLPADDRKLNGAESQGVGADENDAKSGSSREQGEVIIHELRHEEMLNQLAFSALRLKKLFQSVHIHPSYWGVGHVRATATRRLSIGLGIFLTLMGGLGTAPYAAAFKETTEALPGLLESVGMAGLTSESNVVQGLSYAAVIASTIANIAVNTVTALSLARQITAWIYSLNLSDIKAQYCSREGCRPDNLKNLVMNILSLLLTGGSVTLVAIGTWFMTAYDANIPEDQGRSFFAIMAAVANALLAWSALKGLSARMLNALFGKCSDFLGHRSPEDDLNSRLQVVLAELEALYSTLGPEDFRVFLNAISAQQQGSALSGVDEAARASNSAALADTSASPIGGGDGEGERNRSEERIPLLARGSRT